MTQILLLIFCLFSIPLFSADHRTSQRAREKHKKMREELRKGTADRFALLGSASDFRSTLAAKGITFSSSFVTDMLGNPLGGKARGFAYAGSYGLSMNIDLTEAGWKGFDLFSSAVWRTGTNLSQRKIDNQFPVAQVFGSQTVKLNELYFCQTLFDGNFALKAGRLDAGNDFLASPLYGMYVNNAFNGNPISIFFNVPFTAYPNSTWGAQIYYKPFKRFSTKWGVYNANQNIKKDKYHGVNFTFKSTNGMIWITEWSLLINQEKGDGGMPGNYKAGYFYLTGKEAKFTGGSQSGDPCFYLLFDQMIYRKKEGADRGLTPFVSFVFAPENRNLFPFFWDCGLVFKGLFDSRPQDVLNLGFVYGKYSRDKATVQKRRGEEPQNFESVVELNYWVQINPWFYIAPDMQYIIHPKGRDTPNAYVIGAQIGIDLW